MKIWCISDTHMNHNSLVIPNGIDIVIHSGDSTNFKNPILNKIEFDAFSDWFIKLNIKNKILIAGNHDAWALKKYNTSKLKDNGIIYLENEYTEINNIKFYGSPITPVFGEWYFTVKRENLDKYWKHIEHVDILITHGPPKTILDLSYNIDNELEFCGDKSLYNHIFNTIKPKYHVFGHIHNNEKIINQGIRIINDITFMNVSTVTDNQFNKGVSSNGLIIEI